MVRCAELCVVSLIQAPVSNSGREIWMISTKPIPDDINNHFSHRGVVNEKRLLNNSDAMYSSHCTDK